MPEFMNIVLLLVLILIGFVITGSFYGFRRGNTLVALLKQGKYEEALEQIERQLEQHKDQKDKASLITFLAMQKAEITFFLGRFQESINLLRQVATAGATMPLKLWHTTLTLQNLLLSEQLEEAKVFYQEQRYVLEPADRERLQVANTLDFAQGLYHYYLGEPEQSKVLFEKLAKRSVPRRYLAVSTFYLGKIDEQQGNREAAALKLEQAKLIDEQVFANISKKALS